MWHRTRAKVCVASALVISCLWAMASLAADDVTGQWQLSMEFGDRQMNSTLLLYRSQDGTLQARWGASELSQVKLDGQKLSFVRTVRFGDQEFSMTFQGTIQGGRLTGTISSERGDFSITGIKKTPKPDMVGQWDVGFEVFDRPISARLVVQQRPDGALTVQWTEEPGQHNVSGVKYQDGRLTFVRSSKIEDMEFETTFEGTVKDNRLTGLLKGQMGQFNVTGKRVGADLIGLWELSTVSEMGTRQSLLVIDNDLTGTYEGFGGEFPIKDLKIDGQRLSFTVEMGFGDRTFQIKFNGTCDGKTIKGQSSSERGTNEVTGKKLTIPLPGQVASGIQQLIGTWEFTTETPGGVRTNTLKINPDMTGTYSSRNQDTPIEALKVDGDQVSFKITRTFNDQQFTMEFKGRLIGDELVGEFVSQRGSRPAKGKKIGQ